MIFLWGIIVGVFLGLIFGFCIWFCMNCDDVEGFDGVGVRNPGGWEF